MRQDYESKIYYVGITNNFPRRKYEHQKKYQAKYKGARFLDDTYDMECVATGLSNGEARAMEQALITGFVIIYFEWQYQTARFELLDGNVQSTMSAYRIKKPFKKEVSIGVFFPGSIDKGTTRLSNIMNIMELVSIVILCLILAISYNIDTHMNITAVAIGVFVTFLLFLFHIILESYNHFCSEICKVINADLDVLITDNLDDVVSRNRSRITMTLVATVLVLMLNLLSVFFM